MDINTWQPSNHYEYYQNPRQMDPQPHTGLQHQTLAAISPAVSHGLREAQHLGYEHALREAVAIGYLMGRGYDYHSAWQHVESWWRPPGTSLPTPY